jgi:hypothetical protein
MSRFTVRGDAKRASRVIISALLLVVLVLVFAYPLLVSPASSVTYGTRAISDVSNTGEGSDTVTQPEDMQPLCDCSQEIELISGIRVSGDHVEATFRNPSTTCSHLVGIASYRKFNESVAHQELFAFEQRTLNPGETATLSASLPPCASAADAFCGDVIQSFQGGVRYGSRILDDLHTGGAYCSRIAITQTPTPINTPSPTRTRSPSPTTRPSNTPAASPTFIATPTSTGVPSSTALVTSTPTFTGTPSATTQAISPGPEYSPTPAPSGTRTEAATYTPVSLPTSTSTPGNTPFTATPLTVATIVPATSLPRPENSQTPNATPTLTEIKSSPTSTSTIVSAARATRTALPTAVSTSTSEPTYIANATRIADTSTPTATSKPPSTNTELPASTPSNVPIRTATVSVATTEPIQTHTPQPTPTHVEEVQGETGGPPTPTSTTSQPTPTVAPPDRPPKLGVADSLWDQVLGLVSLSGLAILMGIRLVRRRNGGATLRM